MKRFTETLKWADPWHRRLSPHAKLLWDWMLGSCDHAGVIDLDLELAEFQIGYPYPLDTLLEFGERLQKLPNGKIFIPSFITFQYGTISAECKAHNPVFASIEKNQIKGYPKGINTLPDKDKDKDNTKSRGTEQEFRAFAATIGLPETDGEFLHCHLVEAGWKRGKVPIKDWQATMRKWKQGGWLPSQKSGITPKPAQDELALNRSRQ